jgi:hypothetical protein
MIITLSNGTQIEERAMGNGATEAVILPDERGATEAEWQEYALYVRNLNLEQSRARLASRKVSK